MSKIYRDYRIPSTSLLSENDFDVIDKLLEPPDSHSHCFSYRNYRDHEVVEIKLGYLTQNLNPDYYNLSYSSTQMTVSYQIIGDKKSTFKIKTDVRFPGEDKTVSTTETECSNLDNLLKIHASAQETGMAYMLKEVVNCRSAGQNGAIETLGILEDLDAIAEKHGLKYAPKDEDDDVSSVDIDTDGEVNIDWLYMTPEGRDSESLFIRFTNKGKYICPVDFCGARNEFYNEDCMFDTREDLLDFIDHSLQFVMNLEKMKNDYSEYVRPYAEKCRNEDEED